MINPRKLLLLILGTAFALAAGQALAAVGRFVYVEGVVSVRDASGAVRAVRAGDAVNAKDTVITAEGRAQIRFHDDGWISLHPFTVFEVKEYPQRSNGNIVLSLLKGSVRAVSGLISRIRHERYHFVTPVAIIGIRGTSFLVTYCVQSCDVPDGLYVTGGDGTIYVKNGFGEIDLTHGHTAYVANARTAPRESSIKPLAEVPEPMTSDQISAAGSATTGELRPGNYIYSAGTGGYVGPFTTMPISSLGVATAASGTVSGSASGILNGIPQTGSGSSIGPGFRSGAGVVPAGYSLSLTVDSLNRPVSATVTDSSGDHVSLTSLSAPSLSGSDGMLYWGRWTNSAFQADVQEIGKLDATGKAPLGANSNFHYVIGLPVGSMPLSGIATYSFVGGTGSTSQSGTVGNGVTAGALTANFGADTVSAGLRIDHGTIYRAHGFGYLNFNNRATFSSVSGSASSAAGSYPFAFNGFFAGPPAPTAPAGAGMAWQISTPDPIVGAAAFRCTSGC